MSDVALRGEGKTPLLSIIKVISFIVLSAISISLSVYLFLQFSTHPVERILFGALAVAFEGSKLYALVDGHKEWVEKKFIPALTKLTMYVMLAALSVIASYGFSLGALQRAELDPGASRAVHQAEAIERQIDEIDGQISNFQRQQADLPEGWVTAAQRLQESIDQLVERRTSLYDDLYEIEEPDFDLASNAFILIGRSIGMEGEMVMFILLIVLAFAIELCIVFTSPSVDHPDRAPPYKGLSPELKDLFAKETEKHEEVEVAPIPKPEKEEKTETPPPEPEPVKEEKKDIPSRPKKEEKTEDSKLYHPKPKPKAPEPEKKPSQEVTYLDGLKHIMSDFVHKLFDNGDHTYLKPMEQVENEMMKRRFSYLENLGLSLNQEDYKAFLRKLWDVLVTTKGPTGYLLVAKHEDKDVYIPNYTSELIISVLSKRLDKSSWARTPKSQ